MITSLIDKIVGLVKESNYSGYDDIFDLIITEFPHLHYYHKKNEVNPTIDGISYPIAINENNTPVYILDAEKGSRYSCPHCKGTLIPRALDSNAVSPHFYHYNDEVTECSEGVKHYFLNIYMQN